MTSSRPVAKRRIFHMLGLGRLAQMSDCISDTLSQVSIPTGAMFSNLAARRIPRSPRAYTKSKDSGRTQEERCVLRVRQVLQNRCPPVVPVRLPEFQ